MLSSSFSLCARALGGFVAALATSALMASTLNPSGDLDTSYDSDGKVQHNFGTVLVPADSRALVVQPGGKIVVGGGSNNGLYKDYVLTRLNTNGTIDPSFGDGGVTQTDMGFDDRILAMAQNVAGTRFCGGGISGALFGVACYSANGLLDTAFAAPNGFVRENAPAGVNGGSNVGRIEGMTFDRNGRLVAVGWGDFPSGRDWVIRRWNSDGSGDSSFGNQGWVTVDHGGSDRAFDVAIIPGASIAQDIIVVTGTRTTTPNRAVITLLKMDGSLYTTSNQITGTTGKGYFEPGGMTQFRGVAVQSDNDHVVVTGQGNGFLVARYSLSTAGAQVSANLGTDGNDVGFRARIATVGGNERVYVSGTRNSGVDFDVARLPLNLGAAEYNTGTSLSPQSDFAQDLAVDTSNGFVTVAGTTQGNLNTIAVTRYTAAGVLDTNFATDGAYYAAITGGSTDESKAFAVQADGKMIVAGTTFNSSGDYDLLVTRINSDGTRDSANWANATAGWDTRGFVASSAESVSPNSVAIDSNGKAVVVGGTSGTGFTDYFAVRYNANGTLDTGFDSDGIVRGNWGTNSLGKVVAIDASNNVIVGGEITLNGSFKFSRLAASNGAVDNSFGTSGTATVDIVAGQSDVLKAMAIDPGGKIVAAGSCFTGGGSGRFKICLARLNSNGTLDNGFDGDGKVLHNVAGLDSFDLRSMQLLPDLDTPSTTDYKIVVGGQYIQDSPSQSKWLVARFNMDGSADTSFGTNGYRSFTAGPSTYIGAANSVALQHDEKIVVFGESSAPDTQNPGFFLFRQITLARLNWDGSLDTTYGDNGFRYATQGSDPGEAYQGYIYPQSNSVLKGRAIAANFIIAGDFAFTRYREDPAPLSGAGTPDLVAASDSGRSNTDNITNDTTPTFSGSCSEGETIYLLVNGANTQPRTRQVCPAGGVYSLTPSLPGIPRTGYTISAMSQSGIGDSAASGSIQVTVDAEINPAATISVPTAGSNVPLNPTVSGTSEAVADVVVTTSHALAGGCASPNLANGNSNGSGSGNWTCASNFKQGAHTITVKQTDLAGNTDATGVTRSFNVKVATTTSITSSANPSKFGQSVTFTATVAPAGPHNLDIAGTSVRFVEGATTLATVPLDAAGRATYTPAGLGLTVGLHTIQAVYDENAYWLASQDQLVQEVQKADTTTTLASSANPSVFGQPITFTATVAAVAPGAGIPGGTVDFVIDGAAPQNVVLDASGRATLSTAALSVGTHTVVASYNGSTSYNQSSGALSPVQTVNKASTALGLASSSNPSSRGQNLTFTATVLAVVPGAGLPSGTVNFFLDGAATPSGSGTLTAGVATFSISTLAVGTHTLTATYPGDGNFLTSNGTLSPVQTVNKASSTTTLASSLNPSVFGQSVSFTATVAAVAPASDIATGTVDFVIDGGAPQAVTVDANGKATLTTAALSGGGHSVQANYSGDGNLNSSSGMLTGQQQVSRADTATQVSASSNPSSVGQSVSFTATVAAVAPGSGIPAGSVNFVIDGGTPQPVVLDASGQASYSTSSLTVGPHSVAVSYLASTDFNASSANLSPNQVVNRGDTQATLASSANPSQYGQPVTITASIAAVPPAGGTPTGSVTFSVDGGAPGAAVTLTGGQAVLALPTLSVGTHTVVANYSGDAGFNPTSATLSPAQQIDKAATAASLTSTPNPSIRGQNVDFVATVSAVSPGAGIPTGMVQFFLDGAAAPTASVALAGGSATYSSAALALGPHTMAVNYVGDDNFAASTATLAAAQVVNGAPSTTTLSSSLNPSRYGQAVTFTAAVTAPSSPQLPGGSVNFVIDGGTPQPATLDGNARATFTTSNLAAGTHTVVANYAGDANAAASSGTLAPVQTVDPAITSSALVSSANPSSFGQSVTFTASVSTSAPNTPVGTVEFVVDGGSAVPVTLDAAGQATFTTSALSVGTHSVSANYPGSSNYGASSSSLTPQQTVNEAAAAVALQSSQNPSAQGSAVTFTATVTAVAPASGVPAGAVDFVIDGGTPTTVALSAGVATLTTSALTPGTHTVVANYDGSDPRFLTGSATLTPNQNVFPVDYGDAPAPYATRLVNDGARHHMTGPRLGLLVDAEPDGLPSADADGDDTNASDDEDGVSVAAALVPGQNAAATITSSAAAKLDAWIDFNNDGDWLDPGEQIFAATSLAAGANTLSFAVPATTVVNSSVYARFRISTAGGLSFSGFAQDGEVEDYKLTTSPLIDLQVTQAESTDPVVAGSGTGNLVYTISVRNNGPSDASGVVLSEALVLPNGVSLGSAMPSAGTFSAGSWTLGALARNTSATLVLTLTANASATAGSGTVCTTAAVASSTEPRINIGDDSSTECSSVARQVDLVLTQTESIDPVIAGSSANNLVYVLTVANAGPSVASNIAISDLLTLPAGVTLASASPSQGSYTGSSWALGSLANGASATLTLNLSAGPGAASASNAICSAAAVAGLAEPLINPGNDNVTTCTSISRMIDLEVSKTESIDPVGAGSGLANLTHVVSVRNAGPSDASGVVLSELISLPANVVIDSITPSGAGSYASGSWAVGHLAVNTSATLTVKYTVAANAQLGAQVCDTATVTASNEIRVNTGNDAATECTAITRQADLALTKTANVTGIGAGQPLTYTLTVRNAGPADASGVVVTDVLPPALSLVSTSGCSQDPAGAPACTIGTIRSGQTATVAINVMVNANPPAQIVNTASVTATEADPVPANNNASATVSTDVIAPTVSAVDTALATSDQALSNCETVNHRVTGATVVFSEAMNAADANTVANYRLVRAAPTALLATNSCASPPGSDTAIAMAATYDSVLRKSTLSFGGQSISDGVYRLLVCGSLRDLAGNALDGGGGTGTDLLRTFRVDSNNWLRAGHFDTYDVSACSATPWISSVPAAVSVSAAPDVTGSPLSGSAHNTNSTTGFDLEQCAAVPAGQADAVLEADIRVDAIAGTLVSLTPTCRFFSQLACAGSQLSSATAPLLLGPTASNFLHLNRGITVPAAAQSVRCTVTVSRQAGTAFNAYLDRLFLGPDRLFANDFE
ncbi:MAG: Ig-like domain repeat protein [Rhodanobacteraceae bacterium]|nr:Ig-like domain repeat protein [Rhodanobacteraceae bacterium]